MKRLLVIISLFPLLSFGQINSNNNKIKIDNLGDVSIPGSVYLGDSNIIFNKSGIITIDGLDIYQAKKILNNGDSLQLPYGSGECHFTIERNDTIIDYGWFRYSGCCETYYFNMQSDHILIAYYAPDKICVKKTIKNGISYTTFINTMGYPLTFKIDAKY